MTTGLPGELGAVWVSVVPSLAGSQAIMQKGAAEDAQAYSRTFGEVVGSALVQAMTRAAAVGSAFEPLMRKGAAEDAGTYAAAFGATIGSLLQSKVAPELRRLTQAFGSGGTEGGQIFSQNFLEQLRTGLQVTGVESQLQSSFVPVFNRVAAQSGEVFSRGFTTKVAEGIATLGAINTQNIERSLGAAGLRGGTEMGAKITAGLEAGLTTMGGVTLGEAVARVMSGVAVHGGEIFASGLARSLASASSVAKSGVANLAEDMTASLAAVGKVGGGIFNPQVFQDLAVEAEKLNLRLKPTLNTLTQLLPAAAISGTSKAGEALATGLSQGLTQMAQLAVPTAANFKEKLEGALEGIGMKPSKGLNNAISGMIGELQRIGPAAEGTMAEVEKVLNAGGMKSGKAFTAFQPIVQNALLTMQKESEVTFANLVKAAGLTTEQMAMILGPNLAAKVTSLGGLTTTNVIGAALKKDGPKIGEEAGDAVGSGMLSKLSGVLNSPAAKTAMKVGVVAAGAGAAIEFVASVVGEFKKFVKIGEDAARSLTGAFQAVIEGKMPNLMQSFNVLEEGAKAALEMPLNLMQAFIPMIGLVKKTFEPLFAMFDQFKDTMGPVVETIVNVGEQYLGLTRKLAESTIDTSQIEGLSSAVRDIMASGAVVHFEDVADSIGRLNANIQGLDLTHLKELTTTFAEAEELVGHIDETKFAGILNAWDVPAAQANETLTMLVNTARATGIQFNMLTDEMTRIGPAMRDLGYNVDDTASFFALMTQQGEKGTRLIFGMNEIVNKLNASVEKGKFKDVKEGWETIVTAVQKYQAAGTEAGKSDALALLAQYTTPSTAPLLLEDIAKGLISIDSAGVHIKDVNKDLGDAVEETKGLGQTFQVVGQQISAALAPTGVALAGALRNAGNQVTEWLRENQGKVAQWGATLVIIFGQVMTAAARTFMDILTFIGPVLDEMVQMFRISMDLILDVMGPLAKGMSAVFGGVWDKLADGLDKAHAGIDKLGGLDLTTMFQKGDAAVTHFAEDTFPKLASGLQGYVNDFKAVEEVNKAFEEQINGKMIPAVQGLKDATGGFGTKDNPSLQLLGGPDQWRDVTEKLAKQGIAIKTNIAGVVTSVTFPGAEGVSGEDAKKTFQKWWDENVGKTPAKLGVEPQTKDGKKVGDAGDLVPPGETSLTFEPRDLTPRPVRPGYGPTGYALGGSTVQGQWVPGQDTIPAMLEVGEYVVRRDQAQKHRRTLDAINSGYAGFDTGGDVDPGLKVLLYGFAKGVASGVGLELPKDKGTGTDTGTSTWQNLVYPSSAAKPSGATPSGGVPLVQNPDGTWTSSNPAWAHLIKRESSGILTNVQHGFVDANTGGNEAQGLFQITPATWRAHGGAEFAPTPNQATAQQQAAVAGRIIRANPSGSDWGAGLTGRESAAGLLAGLGMQTGGSVGGIKDFTALDPGQLIYQGRVIKGGSPEDIAQQKHMVDLWNDWNNPATPWAHFRQPAFPVGSSWSSSLNDAPRKWWGTPIGGQPVAAGGVGEGLGRGEGADVRRHFKDGGSTEAHHSIDSEGHYVIVDPVSPWTGLPMFHDVGKQLGGPVCAFCGGAHASAFHDGGIAGFQGGGGVDKYGVDITGAQIDTIQIADALAQMYPGHHLGLYSAPDGMNEHSSGEAIDFMTGDAAVGTAVKNWALGQPGVLYALWQQQEWHRGQPPIKMDNRGSPTQNHMDHVHIRTAGGGFPAGSGPGPQGVGSFPQGTVGIPAGAPTGAPSGGPGGDGSGTTHGTQSFPAGSPIGPSGILGPGPNPWSNPQSNPAKQQEWLHKYEEWQLEESRKHTQYGKAQQDLTDATQDQADAQKAFNDEDVVWKRKLKEQQLPDTPEGWAKLAAMDKQEAEARKKVVDKLNAANDKLGAATDKSTQDALDQQVGHPPPEPGKGQGQGGPMEGIAQQLGGGLVKGALQALGFPDVFGKAITEWGIWKLGMGALGFGLNVAEQKGLFGGGGGGFPGSLPGQFGGPLGTPPGPPGGVPLTPSTPQMGTGSGPSQPDPNKPGYNGPPIPGISMPLGSSGQFIPKDQFDPRNPPGLAPGWSWVQGKDPSGKEGYIATPPKPAAPPAPLPPIGPNAPPPPPEPGGPGGGPPLGLPGTAPANSPGTQLGSSYGPNGQLGHMEIGPDGQPRWVPDAAPGPGRGGPSGPWGTGGSLFGFGAGGGGSSSSGFATGGGGPIVDSLIGQLPHMLVGMQAQYAGQRGDSRGAPPAPSLMPANMQAGRPSPAVNVQGAVQNGPTFNVNNSGMATRNQFDSSVKRVVGASNWPQPKLGPVLVS